MVAFHTACALSYDITAEMTTQTTPAAASPSPRPGAARETEPRERVFTNTLAGVVSQAAGDGSLVVAALIQVKTLSPLDWGLYGFLLSAFEILRVLSDAGLHVVGIRLMAIRSRSPRVVERQILILKTLLAALGLAIAAGVSVAVPVFSEHRRLVLLLGPSLFPIAYAAGLGLRFQAEHRMEQLIAPRAAAGGLYLGSVAAGAWWGCGVGGYLAMYVAYQFVVWFGTAIASRRTWPSDAVDPVPWLPDWRLAGAIGRQASAVALLQMLVITYSRLGVLLLRRVGSLATVGQYYTALKITEPLVTLAGAFSTSAFPVLTRLVHAGDAAAARRRFVKYSVRSAVFCSALAGTLTVGAEAVLRWIGPESVAATGALIALGWATVFMFQNQLSTSLINAFGKFHYVTAISAVNLAVFLVLCYLLVPGLGATGAALALLGTEAGNAAAQLATAFLLLWRLEHHG